MQPKQPEERSANASAKRLGSGVRGQTGLSGLGLLFLIGLYHEVSHAHVAADQPRLVRELLELLAQQPEQAQPLIDLLVETHPELAEQLLAPEVRGGELALDLQALEEQLLDLEASGYLAQEEVARLRAALRALQAQTDGDDGASLQLAQAAPASASDAGAGASADTTTAEEAALEALPATGAGPALVGLGPFLGLSGVGAVAANNLTTTAPKDTTPPGALTFALASDTGVSSTDGITNNGRVNIAGLENGASWEYSTDGGAHWTQGSGSSFTMDGTALYLAGAVQVRQIDAAGNVGPVAINSVPMTVGLGTPLAVDSAHEAAILAILQGQGNADGYLNTLDLQDGAVTLTDAQAYALVSEGLAFAADDTGVTVQDAGFSSAQGTQLHTSLSGLQALGVDNIDLTSGNGLVTIDLGNASGVDVGHLPAIASAGAGVALGIEDSELDFLVTNAQALRSEGFDAIKVADTTIALTDDQAAALVSAGLYFAESQTVSMEHMHAAGTHLNTSLADLQHLGVDSVHTTSGPDTVVVQLGDGASLQRAPLPVFDSIDKVTLVVRDDQVAGTAAFVSTYDSTVGVNPHIDNLRVVLHDALGAELGGKGVLDPVFQGMGIELDASNSTIPEITLGMILEAADGSADPLATLTGTDLRNALQAAGIVDLHIDSGTTVKVDDTDLKPLLDAGLFSADAAAVVKVSNADGTLDVTLAQLAAIGADQVQVTGGSVTLDAGVTFTDATGLENALTDLLATYEAQAGSHPVSDVFAGGDTVNLTVAGTLGGALPTGYHLDPALVTKLELLGIDDVIDDHGHSIK